MGDRGARLVALLRNLEGISVRPGEGYNPDDLSAARYNTSKILQYVSGQEKVYRDVFLKNSCHLDLILSVLENCCDLMVEQTVVLVLQELVGKTSTGKRASTLVSRGTTHVLFSVLVSESRSGSGPEDLLISIHTLLTKLGPKDRKFGVKARLSGALQVTLNLVKNNTSNPKILQPVLHVLKLYSNNAVNASYLGKNGAVTYLFKLLATCGKKHLTHSKHALDTLTQLVKSKSNSARAVGQGGVPVLLNMFYDWHKSDVKNRHVTLRKAILNVLKHCTNLKAGKKAFTDADGMRILYSTSQDALHTPELDGVVVVSSLIMRKCFPRNRLPLPLLRSPVTCSLPVSEFHVIDSTNEREENGYESSVDNDDDVSSEDEEREKPEHEDEPRDRDVIQPPPRTLQDLQMYTDFFTELCHLEGLTLSNEQPINSDIVIPTASCDQHQQPIRSELRSTHVRGSQSASVLQPSNSATNSVAARKSLPNINTAFYSCDSSDSARNASPFKSLRRDEKPLYKDVTDYTSDANNTSGATVSAVNVKTGASIITLDVEASKPLTNQMRGKRPSSRGRPGSGSRGQGQSQDQSHSNGKSVTVNSNKTPSVTISNSKSPSAATGSNKSLAASHGNRSLAAYHSNSCKPRGFHSDDWLLVGECNPLSITPISTPRERSLEPERHLPDSTDTSPTRQTQSGLFDSGAQESALLDAESSGARFPVACPDVYRVLARRTRSVGRFNKIPYPELYGHLPPPYTEPQHEKKSAVQRAKIFEDIDRFINPEDTLDRVVYDLDDVIKNAGHAYAGENSVLSNRDAYRISRREDSSNHLHFNSQFECGNLRKAIQVRDYEYDLILNPDVNTNHHHQWFYFEVSNMEAGAPYRFNIVNCEKLNSQFNFGMKPVMFSVTEAINRGNAHWLRAGTDICYYRNHYARSSQATGGVRGKSYYTGSFNITFEHDRDICYIAYHYPYSYTMLKTHMHQWEQEIDENQIYYKNQVLCQSVGGNDINLITMTTQDTTDTLKRRPYMFLTSRVHPGESNSSWVMKGTIEYLLSDRAKPLRDLYIFKIVPMLNPDGVINGNHRCSLTGEDLNRCWLNPCPTLHPSIYHTKGLLQFLGVINRTPLVFCDYHGHSRKKNVFLYGCSPSLSWLPEDLENKVEDTGYKTLPKILQSIAPSFSFNNCSYVVEKGKESTARVVVWREIGVVRSYTMESTYCGCDQGVYKGLCISTRELEEMGRKFCEGLYRVRSRHIKNSSSTASATQLDQRPDAAGGALVCDAASLDLQDDVTSLLLASDSDDDVIHDVTDDVEEEDAQEEDVESS